MALTDPLGDMLTRIRNGQMSGRPTVVCPSSKLRANVLEVLKREGFIRDFSWAEVRSGLSELTIELKYHDGEPVIREIKRIHAGMIGAEPAELPGAGRSVKPPTRIRGVHPLPGPVHALHHPPRHDQAHRASSARTHLKVACASHSGAWQGPRRPGASGRNRIVDRDRTSPAVERH